VDTGYGSNFGFYFPYLYGRITILQHIAVALIKQFEHITIHSVAPDEAIVCETPVLRAENSAFLLL
jgi:hypothetical protein